MLRNGVYRKIKKGTNMNCFCNLFDNEVVWLIIIALLLLNNTCNGNGSIGRSGCGCGCSEPVNYGCGCN